MIKRTFEKKMGNSLKGFATRAIMIFGNMKAIVEGTYKCMAYQNLESGCSSRTVGEFSYDGQQVKPSGDNR